jgi:Icc-related predicted phosphoesterase
MPLKIVVISDSHMQHAELDIPDGDVLIHAGDALGRGTYSEAVKFNEWLGTLPHKHKIYVPGNHDELFEVNPEQGKLTMTNAIVLIDEYIEIEGVKIYGSPWTKKFYDWSFMKPDHQLQPIWEKIPEGLDILITHGPPYDILDHNRQGDLCGSMTLRLEVIKKAPKFHVFGHIHEASGVIKMANNNTTFINAAVLNEYYNEGASARVFEV